MDSTGGGHVEAREAGALRLSASESPPTYTMKPAATSDSKKQALCGPLSLPQAKRERGERGARAVPKATLKGGEHAHQHLQLRASGWGGSHIRSRTLDGR